MALQKRRLGKSRIRNRRSAWAGSFKKAHTQNCPNCDAPKLSHRVCIKCGQYNGKTIFEVEQAEE